MPYNVVFRVRTVPTVEDAARQAVEVEEGKGPHQWIPIHPRGCDVVLTPVEEDKKTVDWEAVAIGVQV